jgi:hypothetical protein
MIQIYTRGFVFAVMVFYGLSGCMGDPSGYNLGTSFSENTGDDIGQDTGGVPDDGFSDTPSDIQDNSIVDNDYVGAYPSLTVDSDGRLHASYYAKRDDPGAGALRHAILQDNMWTVETVDGDLYSSDGTIVDVGRYTSIAADSQGGIHISYWDATNNDLKYATLLSGEGQSWLIQTLALPSPVSDIGQGTSLRIDASDSVYIGYTIPGSSLYYATNKNGDWVHEKVASVADVSTKMTIRVDSLGRVHTAFFDGKEKKIKYGFRTLNGWEIEEVTALGSTEALVGLSLDSVNKPHIVYYDFSQLTLKHATKSSIWTIEVVDEVGDPSSDLTDEFFSMSGVIDHLDQLHVSYYDGINDDLKHAILGEEGWETYTVATGGTSDVGRTSAIAEDDNGWIHIVYRDSTNNDLKYAYLQ